MNSERRLLKVKESAVYLGCGKAKVRRMVHENILKMIQDGPRSPWRIDIRDLDAWIESHKQKA